MKIEDILKNKICFKCTIIDPKKDILTKYL